MHDGRAVHRRIADLPLNVLLVVRQEGVCIAAARDVVLGYQPVERVLNVPAHDDFIRADVVYHERGDVVHIGFDIIDVANEIEQL